MEGLILHQRVSRQNLVGPEHLSAHYKSLHVLRFGLRLLASGEKPLYVAYAASEVIVASSVVAVAFCFLLGVFESRRRATTPEEFGGIVPSYGCFLWATRFAADCLVKGCPVDLTVP